MGSETMIHPPQNLDWPTWVARWDRMQARYLVKREERFDTIARLIEATQGTSPRVLDLGCGTGSLMAAILDTIPDATAVGVDLDQTLLWLAEKRLVSYGDRAKALLADLRKSDWPNALTPFAPSPKTGRGGWGVRFSAIVSATALHWLSSAQLSALYMQIASLLQPGGIFLNADHAASNNSAIQSAWERQRKKMRADEQPDATADDWDGFWKAYLAALGPEAQAEREHAIGDWQGVEEGLPLSWHFDHLQQAGFTAVDCFWRVDCDAIYGGVREW
jgi:SAM-dependent methyltransferase